jgi:hypothetical protein
MAQCASNRKVSFLKRPGVIHQMRQAHQLAVAPDRRGWGFSER